MKKFFLIAIVLIGSLSLQRASAQISVSINIGSQPAWAPVGYDHVDYYYLPDINCYYDVSSARFVYLNGGRWIFAKTLPRQYGNYNIYNSYKVVVNRPTPYRNNAQDMREYGRYKGQHSQPIIRDSHEQKYYQSKGSPYHKQWTKQNKQNSRNNRR
ncbi:MAG TPA: hypothetical protein VGB84_02115 [Arachidicoccus sp.]